ncbi:NADAR domain-containing protein [soil metagenome]
MHYSKEWLIEQIAQGKEFDYLLFYGHKPSTDGSITASCLSQWYLGEFEIDGIKYLTAEHYMMAEKARLFADQGMLANILACKTPKEAKAFGRQVQNFETEAWQKHCIDIVVRANQAKFLANSGFADWLIATTPKILVEASMWDKIWGIGMVASAPGALEPKRWKGRNLLGFALMEVRDKLVEGKTSSA